MSAAISSVATILVGEGVETLSRQRLSASRDGDGIVVRFQDGQTVKFERREWEILVEQGFVILKREAIG